MSSLLFRPVRVEISVSCFGNYPDDKILLEREIGARR